MADFLKFRSLEAPFGAEVDARDFAFAIEATAATGDLDSAPFAAALREALDRHGLLVFRGADPEPTAQVALLEAFGPPLIENDSGRAYQFVSNTHEEGILGNARFSFHSDHAFMPDPIDVISLQAIELPASGTRTHFVNALLAARELPDRLRRPIAEGRARHIIDPSADSDAIASDGPALPDGLPHAIHPILMPHPSSGESILYVSEQQTDRIEGLDPPAGKALLDALFEHLYADAYRYSHDWQPGDLVVWDNRALQHAREAIGPTERRTLRRVSVGGTSVFEYFAEAGHLGPG